jgi:ribosomal protein S18 acetylase RimI-like enzyme
LSGDHRLAFGSDPSPDDIELLEDRVREATVAATGHHDLDRLAAFVRADDGSLIAGIAGWTWGGTCELQDLWVDPAHRGSGLGRQLLVEAEAEARRRGCGQMVLFTHEVHAPGLYERLGYELVGRVDDYPVGGAASWYHKAIASSPISPPPSR